MDKNTIYQMKKKMEFSYFNNEYTKAEIKTQKFDKHSMKIHKIKS